MTDVVAGVLRDDRGRVLIQERTKGEYAGRWEIPGGKILPGEAFPEALQREWMEELGIVIKVRGLLATAEGLAPIGFRLHFYAIEALGLPTPLEGQRIAWVDPHNVSSYPLLPKDEEFIRQLL